MNLIHRRTQIRLLKVNSFNVYFLMIYLILVVGIVSMKLLHDVFVFMSSTLSLVKACPYKIGFCISHCHLQDFLMDSYCVDACLTMLLARDFSLTINHYGGRFPLFLTSTHALIISSFQVNKKY